MEEENNPEPQVEVQNEVEKFNLKSFGYKKYLPWAGIAVAVVAIIIILVVVLGGGPKKAVKGFISGMNNKNASKILESIDPAGTSAWYYDEDDFSKDDYEEFIEDYNKVDKDKIEEWTKYAEEGLNEIFDEIDDEFIVYKFKIEKFNSVEKLGKDLYVIKAEISLTAKPQEKDKEEINDSSTAIFVVYKSKIIVADMPKTIL